MPLQVFLGQVYVIGFSLHVYLFGSNVVVLKRAISVKCIELVAGVSESGGQGTVGGFDFSAVFLGSYRFCGGFRVCTVRNRFGTGLSETDVFILDIFL